jgi:integrase/recombinase XerD
MLDITDLDASMVAAVLDHLETERGTTARAPATRWLAAIHSLYRYAALRHPEHAQDIQRRAIDPAQTHRPGAGQVPEPGEIEALLAAPDRSTWTGRRDHALLLTATQTGLRASELTALDVADVQLNGAVHLACVGTGRKQRITPLTATTAAMLRVWVAERAGNQDDPLFPTIRGRRLSRDGLERRLAKHIAHTARHHPGLRGKNVTLDTLRHTAAMQLLHAGIDHRDRAVARARTGRDHPHLSARRSRAQGESAGPHQAPDAKPGRYRPPDALHAFLEALQLCRPQPAGSAHHRGVWTTESA